jgi:hypothetical protein
MSKAETEQKPAGGDIQSIKEAIQSLALELWFDKRNTIEGVDWLVDGRLVAQLDELSKSQLLRIKRLLAQNIVRTPSVRRYMTAGRA